MAIKNGWNSLEEERRMFEEKKALDIEIINHEVEMAERRAAVAQKRMSIYGGVLTELRPMYVLEDLIFGDSSDDIKKVALDHYAEISMKIVASCCGDKVELAKLILDREKNFDFNSLDSRKAWWDFHKEIEKLKEKK